MKKRKRSPMDCVIRDAVNNYVLRTDAAVGPEELKTAAPLKQLLAMGLTAAHADQLEIGEPVLESIRELVRQDGKPADLPERSLEAVKNTLRIVTEQIQGIDMEIHMLNLRKKALKRRSVILSRLEQCLSSHLDHREAA
jgi:hypothetical protein